MRGIVTRAMCKVQEEAAALRRGALSVGASERPLLQRRSEKEAAFQPREREGFLHLLLGLFLRRSGQSSRNKWLVRFAQMYL